MRIISKLLSGSRMKLVISSIGVLALLVFSGIVLFEATKAEVVITDNGESQTVTTHQDTVEGLLNEVGIAVGEHDDVSQPMNAEIKDGMSISYKTAKKVIVTVDGEKQEYYTTTGTVEAFLSDQDLSFAAHDEVSHESTQAIEDGLHIEVTKAYEVTINDGLRKRATWATGGTVEDLLNSNDIRFNKQLDEIKPAINEYVTDDTVITIVHVEKATDEVTEKLAFDTVKREDSSLLKGKEKVIAEGEEGTVIKKFEVTKKNGEEVDRELVHKNVKKESKNRVVAIGTKEVQQEPEPELVQLSSTKQNTEKTTKQRTKPSSSNSDGKVLYMTSSAYTATCSGCSGHTATGINLKANPNIKVIAVDPNVIPLGTKVWVEGYGEAVAGDTGGSIVGNRIDVHVPSKAAAYKWGRRTVKVKVLH